MTTSNNNKANPKQVKAAYQQLSKQAKLCFNRSIWVGDSTPGTLAHWHIPMYNHKAQYEKFNAEILHELVEFMKVSGLNERIFEIEIIEYGISAAQLFAIVTEPAFPKLEELWVLESDVFEQLAQRRDELMLALPTFRMLAANNETGKVLHLRERQNQCV